MGVTGSGKSTVGVLLADQLKVPFADGDDFHSDRAKALMAAGHPLTDADRAPWLRAQASWLAQPANDQGCVLACSALKRRYRDVLRSGRPDAWFLHLAGDPVTVRDRVDKRRGHFMPATLVGSQYADLEPLQPDERGVAVDFGRPPAQIVREFLVALAA